MTPMTRQPVESSNIASVGFDHESNTLQVEFKSGDVYEYKGVQTHEWRALMNAESIGRELNATIKPNYPGVKVGTVEAVEHGA